MYWMLRALTCCVSYALSRDPRRALSKELKIGAVAEIQGEDGCVLPKRRYRGALSLQKAMKLARDRHYPAPAIPWGSHQCKRQRGFSVVL